MSGIQQSMWGLTCYFNPFGWRSRRRSFKAFLGALKIPVIVVEWSPAGKFEVEPISKQLKVLQVRGGSILWQKERLLNMGARELPDDCTHVTFMDADLIFEDDDWADQAMATLETHQIIQPFSEVCHLPLAIVSDDFLKASEEPEYSSRCLGLGHALSMAPNPKEVLNQIISNQSLRFRALLKHGEEHERSRMSENENAFKAFPIPTPGLAWSCSRETLDNLGDIPDRFIGGGGDLFLMLGLLGRGEDLTCSCIAAGLSYVNHEAYRRFCGAIPQTGMDFGFLPQRVFHLNHGSLSNRRYDSRHVALQRLNIDLDKHLDLSKHGLLRFRGAKKMILEQNMRRFFIARREDGDHEKFD